MKRIAMSFKDGDAGNRMRPEFAGKATLDLILSRDRTGTSRDFSKTYNRDVPKIGELVTFYDKRGREVVCRITSAPQPLKEIDPTDWSLSEGWNEATYHKLLRSGDYYQIRYELAQ